MGRWLAPRVAAAGPQRWLLHDRDADLLVRAAASMPTTAAGRPVSVETVLGVLGFQGDGVHGGTGSPASDTSASGPSISGPGSSAVGGTDAVVASALLDLLTAADVDALVRACATAGCAALLALSVTGEVTLDPADPLDGRVSAAFDAHQRRRRGDGRRLLGPDAPGVAAAAFVRYRFRVWRRAACWRLGPTQPALIEEWLRGRVDAACAQDPTLTEPAGAYLERRLDAVATGALRAEVGHVDLLALPGTPPVPAPRPSMPSPRPSSAGS